MSIYGTINNVEVKKSHKQFLIYIAGVLFVASPLFVGIVSIADGSVTVFTIGAMTTSLIVSWLYLKYLNTLGNRLSVKLIITMFFLCCFAFLEILSLDKFTKINLDYDLLYSLNFVLFLALFGVISWQSKK